MALGAAVGVAMDTAGRRSSGSAKEGGTALAELRNWIAPPLFFPDTIWLGAAAMILGIGEILMHSAVGFGVQLRRHRHMGFYDPGLATAALLGVTAVSYFALVISHGLIGGWDWLRAVLYFLATLILFLIIPENGFSSPTTQWAHAHDENFLGYYKRFTTPAEVFATPSTGQSDPTHP